MERISDSDRFKPIASDIEHRRMGAKPVLLSKTNVRRSTNPPHASEEIAGRIANTLKEWEEHRVNSASPHSKPTDAAHPDVEPAVATEADQIDLSNLAAAKRKYSADYLNWQMRIAILESRIESTSGDEQKALLAKLEQAKAALRATDEMCAAEAETAEQVSTQSKDAGSSSAPSDDQATRKSPRDISSSAEWKGPHRDTKLVQPVNR